MDVNELDETKSIKEHMFEFIASGEETRAFMKRKHTLYLFEKVNEDKYKVTSYYENLFVVDAYYDSAEDCWLDNVIDDFQKKGSIQNIIYYNALGNMHNEDGPAYLMFNKGLHYNSDHIEYVINHGVEQYCSESIWFYNGVEHSPNNVVSHYERISGANTAYYKYGKLHNANGSALRNWAVISTDRVNFKKKETLSSHICSEKFYINGKEIKESDYSDEVNKFYQTGYINDHDYYMVELYEEFKLQLSNFVKRPDMSAKQKIAIIEDHIEWRINDAIENKEKFKEPLPKQDKTKIKMKM